MTSQQRILFIDDDPDALNICAHVFRKRGYIVKTLKGCDNLLELVEEFSPHLIFMDHNIPNICGDEAIKLLKLHNNTKYISVILFSAEINIGKLANEAGADAYLKKPFRIETIIALASSMAGTD